MLSNQPEHSPSPHPVSAKPVTAQSYQPASDAGAQGPLRRLSAQALRGLRSSVASTVDFVIPPTCPVCADLVQTDGGLCGSCWHQVPWIDGPVCNRLGTPLAYDLGPGAVSAEALANPPEFERLRAVCIHEGVAPQLVHALKFAQQRHLADVLGAMMARAGRVVLQERDVVLVPVPLHPLRQWQRRYNQSALLARAIGSITGAPVVYDAVKRVKRTRQQLSLSRGDRLRNVRGAFRLSTTGQGQLAGKRVVLIDDVHTTGATLNALAHAIARPGAEDRPVGQPAAIDALVFSTAVVSTSTSPL